MLGIAYLSTRPKARCHLVVSDLIQTYCARGGLSRKSMLNNARTEAARGGWLGAGGPARAPAGREVRRRDLVWRGRFRHVMHDISCSRPKSSAVSGPGRAGVGDATGEQRGGCAGIDNGCHPSPFHRLTGIFPIPAIGIELRRRGAPSHFPIPAVGLNCG